MFYILFYETYEIFFCAASQFFSRKKKKNTPSSPISTFLFFEVGHVTSQPYWLKPFLFDLRACENMFFLVIFCDVWLAREKEKSDIYKFLSYRSSTDFTFPLFWWPFFLFPTKAWGFEWMDPTPPSGGAIYTLCCNSVLNKNVDKMFTFWLCWFFHSS